MIERKYSLSEIDEMRQLVRQILEPPPMTPYFERELAASAEDRLRTYMLAGVEPQELRAKASQKMQSMVDRGLIEIVR